MMHYHYIILMHDQIIKETIKQFNINAMSNEKLIEDSKQLKQEMKEVKRELNNEAGIDVSKAETIEQFKQLVEANENGLFKIGPRSNRRKKTRGRRTQVIKVPKYIVNPELSEDVIKNVKQMMKGKENLKINYNSEIGGKKVFIKNPSPFAGKTKQIFHATIK